MANPTPEQLEAKRVTELKDMRKNPANYTPEAITEAERVEAEKSS